MGLLGLYRVGRYLMSSRCRWGWDLSSFFFYEYYRSPEFHRRHVEVDDISSIQAHVTPFHSTIPARPAPPRADSIDQNHRWLILAIGLSTGTHLLNRLCGYPSRHAFSLRAPTSLSVRLNPPAFLSPPRRYEYRVLSL